MPIRPRQLKAFREELQKVGLAFGLEKDLKQLGKERGLTDKQVEDLKTVMGLHDTVVFRNPTHTAAHSFTVNIPSEKREDLKAMPPALRRKTLNRFQKRYELKDEHMEPLLQGKSIVVIHGREAPTAEVLAHELGHVKNRESAIWRTVRNLEDNGEILQGLGALQSVATASPFWAGPIMSAVGGLPIPIEEAEAWRKGLSALRESGLEHSLSVPLKAWTSHFYGTVVKPTAAVTAVALVRKGLGALASHVARGAKA
jgi:hypothetical protein